MCRCSHAVWPGLACCPYASPQNSGLKHSFVVQATQIAPERDLLAPSLSTMRCLLACFPCKERRARRQGPRQVRLAAQQDLCHAEYAQQGSRQAFRESGPGTATKRHCALSASALGCHHRAHASLLARDSLSADHHDHYHMRASCTAIATLTQRHLTSHASSPLTPVQLCTPSPSGHHVCRPGRGGHPSAPRVGRQGPSSAC